MATEDQPQIFQFQGLSIPVITPLQGIQTQIEVPVSPEVAQQFTFFAEEPEQASEETKESEETEKVEEVKTRDATLKKTTRSWWSCA